MASRSASRPRLAIVGASVRAAAQSAIRAGYDVVAADLFADVDLTAIAPTTRVRDYPAGFVPWLAGVEADAWTYTGGLENHPELVDQLAGILPLWGNAGEPLRRCRDLPSLHAALDREGIPFPETRADPTGLPTNGSWLCKSVGSGGSGVWLLDDDKALHRACSAGAAFQRRLTPNQGVPASVVFVLGSAGENTILGVTHQLVGTQFGAAPFQYAGSAGPIEVSARVRALLNKLATALAGDLRLRGIVGVDIWLGDDQLWVLEVNPRYCASVEVLEMATGVSAFARVPDLCPDRPSLPPSGPTTRTRRSAKKLIVYSKCRLTTPPNGNPEAAGNQTGSAQTWLADIPPGGTTVEAGAPVMTLLGFTGSAASDRRFAEAMAAAQRRLNAAIQNTPPGDTRSEDRSSKRHPRPRRPDAGSREDARES